VAERFYIGTQTATFALRTIIGSSGVVITHATGTCRSPRLCQLL